MRQTSANTYSMMFLYLFKLIFSIARQEGFVCFLNSLLVGSFIDLDGTVPGTASNRVEFKVLLKGLARATCEHKTFLFVVHS